MEENKWEIINEILTNRRSVRLFIWWEKISESHINKIIEAGLYAPSSKNRQTWELVALTDEYQKKILEEINKQRSKWDNDFLNRKKYLVNIFENSSKIILIFDKWKSVKYAEDWHEIIYKNRYEWDILSIWACIQNMLIQAESLWINSCWIRDIKNIHEFIRKLTWVDEYLISMIALWYSKIKINKKNIKFSINKKWLIKRKDYKIIKWYTEFKYILWFDIVSKILVINNKIECTCKSWLLITIEHSENNKNSINNLLIIKKTKKLSEDQLKELRTFIYEFRKLEEPLSLESFLLYIDEAVFLQKNFLNK